MYQQPFGYGAAPGLSAPSGYENPPLIPPNFNFNAPVIHFGQTLSGATTISTPNPSAMAAAPIARPAFVQEVEGPRPAPTAEDQLHTVFIGDIPDDMSDEWMERICRSLGKLKEWRRAKDGDNESRPFGFAIFEDAESTNTGFRLLEELEIPSIQTGTTASKLTIRMDEATTDYLATLGVGQTATDTVEPLGASANAKDRELDIRAYLVRVMEELKDPAKRKANSEEKKANTEDKTLDVDEEDYVPVKGSGMTVLVGGDDEDSGTMPLAQREIILKEITAFRERSIRRDRNKTWLEEEVKKTTERDESPVQNDSRRRDRNRDNTDDRRGKSTPEIPSGPAADRRRPRDYSQSIKFRSGADRYDRDEDDDIPDEELERRRLEKKRRDLEASFADRERKWLVREKMRTSALEREMKKDKVEDRPTADRESMLARLSKWDDDVEAERQSEEYYRDRQQWARKRVEYRRKENEKDDRDRELEARENQKGQSRAEALADSFLAQQAFEIGAKVNPSVLSGPQPLRLRMTRESIKTAPASPAKRTVEEAEGLLEEEEEEDYQASAKKKRHLIPLEYDGEDSLHNGASKQDRIQKLVSSIPSDTKGLWEYSVCWDELDNSIIEGKIRPFATKKIIEAFGVQEQDLIDFVVQHISSHGSAESLSKELEMTLDEEAEVFVKKMWRMLILETESKKRKINI